MIHLGPGTEAAAVDKAEAIGFSAVFPGIRGEQGQEGVLLMAARSAFAVDALISAAQRGTD
ncbi:hypothetical protein D3C86_1955530 [compost metagenome]